MKEESRGRETKKGIADVVQIRVATFIIVASEWCVLEHEIIE